MRQLPQLHEQLQDIHSLQVKPGDVITFKESSVKKMAFSELIRASKTHWGGGFELPAHLQSEGEFGGELNFITHKVMKFNCD